MVGVVPFTQGSVSRYAGDSTLDSTLGYTQVVPDGTPTELQVVV